MLSSASNQLIDNHDYSDDKQQMDQAASHVKGEKAEQPQNEQDYGNGPKHGASSRLALK
jgi:hypothetical protein